jgi:hypothetical protein
MRASYSVIAAANRDSSLAYLAVLVWLEDVALSEAARSLPGATADSGVSLLVESCLAGIDRLDADTTESRFVGTEVDDYEPDGSPPLLTEQLCRSDAALHARQHSRSVDPGCALSQMALTEVSTDLLTISLTTRPLRAAQNVPRPLVEPWAHLGLNQGPPACE